MPVITSVTTEVISFEPPNSLDLASGVMRFWDNIIYHVETDEGVRGSASTFALRGGENREKPEPESSAYFFEAEARRIGPAFVGEDIFSQNKLWDKLFARAGFTGPSLQFMSAFSGIDMAIWDAVGKVTGQPLYKLLGGTREPIPVYNGEMFEVQTKPAEAWVEKAKELVGKGFMTLKMLTTADDEAIDREKVAAVREAVGPEIGLICDFNARSLSYNDTLRRARNLEPYDLLWIDDPFSMTSGNYIEQMARLSAEIPTMIQAGCYSVAEARTLIKNKAIGIVNLMPTLVGGVTGAMRVARMFHEEGIEALSHADPNMGVGLMAACPNGRMSQWLPWWNVLYESPLEVIDGYCTPHDQAGIGYTFSQEAFDRLRVHMGGRP